MDRQEIDANYEEMVAHFKDLGFDHVCHRNQSSGGREFTETWANLEGMFVELNPMKRTFTLSVIDGMIQCKIEELGFPNPHTPTFIQKLRRHLPLNHGVWNG
jgi:hypothetical protein